VQFESTLPRPEGPRSIAGTAAALRQGDTSFGVVLALRDLTDLLVARRQLEFAERLGSLGTLAAGIAHEVNNPLSVVVSGIEYALAADARLPLEVTEALGDALEGARRVARLVGDLRTFSAPQPEQLRAMDAREALGSALAFTRLHWRRVTGVVLDLRPMPPVLASSTRLAQVYVNLIVNAVHAMQPLTDRSHSLTFSTRTDERGWAVVEVSDTGPGIRADLQQRIFEPFFTTKPLGQGTGLGLAVSRTIVESHAGRLEVGSGAGGIGARFTISLPPATAAAEAPPLRVLWVGPPSPVSDALALEAQCRVVSGDETDLRERLAADATEVVLLAVPHERVRQLCNRLPEFDAHGMRLGVMAPQGAICLVRPFDVKGLAAVVRRGEPGHRG
jgi:signal transduction histidine kinase